MNLETAPLFSLVEVIPLAGERWEIVGIYSDRRDAEAHIQRLSESADVLKGSEVVEHGVSMDVIKRKLIKDQLGDLAASLDALCAQLKKP